MSKQKTNSKTKSGMLLILITLFIALVGYVLFSGVSVGVYDIGNVSNNINYGLDLTGGVNVVLEAQATDDEPVTAEKIESAMLTIRQRIDTLGVSEPTITKQGDWIAMNFPAYPLAKMDIPSEIKTSVGFEPQEMYSSIYDWVIAVAASEADILNAKPNLELLKTNGLGHLMITAAGEQPDRDFVLRVFAPLAGIDEDPVTGSAHCALTPLWHAKTGKLEFNSYQLSKRTGRLKVKLLNDRVEIKGQAVTVFQAELKI